MVFNSQSSLGQSSLGQSSLGQSFLGQSSRSSNQDSLLPEVRSGMFAIGASAPLWGDKEIPPWAYESEAQTWLQNQDDDWHPIALGAKRSWRYAFWANVLLWSFWLMFPFVGYATAHCDGKGLAASWGWLYAVYVPFLAGAIFLELLCYRWLLPCLAWSLPPWKIFGIEFSFYQYHALVLMVTISGHADLATSGKFLSQLLASEQCPHNQVANLWKYSIDTSDMPFLPSLNFLGITFWLAMLAQLIAGMGWGVPLDQTWRWVFTGRNIDLGGGVRTPFLQNQLANDVLHAVADSGRMNLILFRYNAFKTQGHGDKIYVPMWKNLGHWYDDRESWKTSVRRIAYRVSLFLLMESSFQPYLQSTVLGINKAATGQVDYGTALSLFLGFGMGVLNIYNAGVQIWTMSKILKDTFKSSDIRNIVEEPFLTAKEVDEQRQATTDHLNRSIAIYVASAALSCCVLSYSFIKTIFALFICPDGMWTIPHCIDMSGYDGFNLGP